MLYTVKSHAGLLGYIESVLGNLIENAVERQDEHACHIVVRRSLMLGLDNTDSFDSITANEREQ